MGFPKHQDPTEGHEATAPYNFVPLPDKVETISLESLPDHDSYDTTRHTGRIEVKLTTASPLYIRGGLSPELFAKIGKKSFHELRDDEKQQVAQFFHTHDENNPVIPGSSLRGMLRSMIEIVTYGKVQPVSDKQLIYREVGSGTSIAKEYKDRLIQTDMDRVFTPLVQAGYMEKRGLDWFIRPAEVINGVTFSRVLRDNVPSNLPRWHNTKTARQIWFKPGPYDYKNVRKGFIKMKFSDALDLSATEQKGLQAGVHIVSGPMSNKKFDRVIYPPDQNADAIPVPDEMVISYREQITKEQKKLLGENGVLQDKQPVFYLMENDELIFFGHTMMLRIPYPKTPKDFVPDILRKEADVDFAEAMFGYVKSNKIPAGKPRVYAGRIFVSDARLAQDANDIWLQDEPIIPKILSGPKPTSFQLYLTQQKPDPYIYETKTGATKSEMHLSHYASPTPDETVIRGHKLYWHHGANPAIKNTDSSATEKQLTQIKPLKSGVTFNFTIQFENLSELELGALWWILKLGANPDYRLKLGMGKPLGTGAIKTEPTLKLTNRRTRYQSLFDGNQWQTGIIEDDDNASIDKITEDFEGFIKENHTDAFGYDGRLAQLFALLNFPGPQSSKTEYMNLRSFRDRNVLPTPRYIHHHNRQRVRVSQYKKFGTVKQMWTISWNSKKNRSETKMPNGEIAVINLKRKAAEKLNNQTVELVIAEIKKGICYLEEY